MINWQFYPSYTKLLGSGVYVLREIPSEEQLYLSISVREDSSICGHLELSGYTFPLSNVVAQSRFSNKRCIIASDVTLPDGTIWQLIMTFENDYVFKVAVHAYLYNSSGPIFVTKASRFVEVMFGAKLLHENGLSWNDHRRVFTGNDIISLGSAYTTSIQKVAKNIVDSMVLKSDISAWL